MDGKHVLEAAGACQALLGAAVDRDWTRRLPHLDFTVAQAVTHMAGGTLWYATDLAAGPERLDTMELRVPPETAPAELVRTIGTFATVLARVTDASPPGARGWHPFGLADASGFAAMACDEFLVHTDDVARGLEVPFAPPRAGQGDPGAAVPVGPGRRRPVGGPAVGQRPHRPPRPAAPGRLALALRPRRGVGRPRLGRPPLTRPRHSSSSRA